MQVARWTGLALLGAVAVAGSAHAESTTGAPGSENPSPGNRGDLGAGLGESFDPRPLFATKLQVQPRRVTAGEPAVAFGTGWIPPTPARRRGG